MLEKLISIFINATSSKNTKRQIEWIMADFIYCIYILIMLGGMVAFISFNAWYALLLVAVSFILLLSVWSWFSFHLRKTILNMLYPPTENMDENGDDNEDSLDKLNTLLKQFAKDLDVKEFQ